MKETLCTTLGLVGSWFAGIFGGWTASLTTLFILMVIDYTTGMMVAGIFQKSTKTEGGGLSSNIGFQGLAKKCMIFLFVLIAHRLDIAMGVTYARDAVCIAYIVNETLSIIENAGVMGVPIPGALSSAIEALKQQNSPEE